MLSNTVNENDPCGSQFCALHLANRNFAPFRHAIAGRRQLREPTFLLAQPPSTTLWYAANQSHLVSYPRLSARPRPKCSLSSYIELVLEVHIEGRK